MLKIEAAPGTLTTGPSGLRVLELDGELAAELPREQRQLATRMLTAPAFHLSREPWRFFPPPQAGALGALVVDPLILVRIETGARAHAELLGPGDIVSPWVALGPDLNVPSVVTATVVAPGRILLLDRRFALQAGRWPEIYAALLHRLIVRSRRLSLQSAVNALPRITERLELTLWHLADRFGRVTSEGILLELPLTHAQLAEIIAAHRPTVTTAATWLTRSGRVRIPRRHHWLLNGPPPAALPALERQAGLAS